MQKELPIGWAETGLLNIVEVCTGKKDANYATSDGKYLFFTCAYEPLRSDDYSFEGDVLILPGNGVNVGEVFYYSGKFEAYQRTYIVSNIKIDPKYLFYHFKRYWKELGTAQQYGSATNYIKIGNFNDYRISFPPLPEQQRIVAKLDTLFGHLDALKTRLDHIPQLLKDFRQKVLTQAVTGKLTEEWREGRELENAILLLQKIKDSRIKNYNNKLEESIKQGTRKPQKPILEVESDSESEFLIPLTSAYCCLGEIGDVVNGSTPSRVKPEYWNGDIPWVSSGLVQNNVITETREYISKEGYDNSSVRTLPKGSILIAMIGEGKTRGQTSILEIEATINQNIAAIIIEHGLVEPKYLQWWLLLNYEQNRVFGNGTGPQALNCQRVRELPFVLYPLEEQQEIVRRVESLFAKADRIEASYQKLKAKIEALPQALLAKAFRGELVEQLPTDGDARDLLEQIKRAKEGLEKGGKSRKMKVVDEVRMVAEAKVKYKKKI